MALGALYEGGGIIFKATLIEYIGPIGQHFFSFIEVTLFVLLILETPGFFSMFGDPEF